MHETVLLLKWMCDSSEYESHKKCVFFLMCYCSVVMSRLALSLFLVGWYAVVPPSAGNPTGTKCEAVEGAPSCVCKSPKGVVNLTKVANFDGTPRYNPSLIAVALQTINV